MMHGAISVKVETKVEVKEADFVMNKAYPNPFNPSITINYSIFAPKGATMDRQLSIINRVTAGIYNTNGALVKKLVNKEMVAGSHEVTWDASEMPSGIYIVCMVAGNVMQSQKIVLMK
jgi:hypothetical protein